MPDPKTLARAKRDKEEGKSANTQVGEFVREEMEHIREGKHGARSPKQAIAIGLSKARRAGVGLQPPKAGTQSPATRRKAAADVRAGGKRARRPSPERSQATEKALRREPSEAASRPALARQARTAAAKRSPASRSASARKAARTRKTAAGRRG